MDLDPGSQKLTDPVRYLSQVLKYSGELSVKISQKARSTGELSMCSMPEI
jgi:hypothetical protein